MVRDLSTVILRQDRVGIIGANGCGKTTLLRLLLGELPPQQGQVRLGSNLEIIYFDQLRDQLDPEKTVFDNVAGGNDTVTLNGRTQHVIGYLQKFLFTPERARTRVKSLSGGERCRLLLARLFTRPANVLVLDEPTNDLDIETLELLEELLLEFKGTLLLVSHDRAFLNNVVTSTLVFSGAGQDRGIRGRLRRLAAPERGRRGQPAAEKPAPKPLPRPRTPTVKMSFKEERELDSLPARLEKLEAEKKELLLSLADPAFYRGAAAMSRPPMPVCSNWKANCMPPTSAGNTSRNGKPRPWLRPESLRPDGPAIRLIVRFLLQYAIHERSTRSRPARRSTA